MDYISCYQTLSHQHKTIAEKAFRAGNSIERRKDLVEDMQLYLTTLSLFSEHLTKRIEGSIEKTKKQIARLEDAGKTA